MTQHTHDTARRRPMTAAAFTLTEVMIALAITALLLVGISRIFAITSATIGNGQALATSMRQQKAIAQTLGNDIGGIGPDIANPSAESGMLPLVNTADETYSMPFMQISNFRVATYLSASDRRSDVVAAVNATPPSTAAAYSSAYRARSLAIRGTDLNKDGLENATSTAVPGGETEPLYFYGYRNFRCDTLSFFSRGNFKSQTGSGAELASGVTSNESYVWYGHLRVYNGEPSGLDAAASYGTPGDEFTPSTFTKNGVTAYSPNLNQQYANDFRLGRMQSLLVEPEFPSGTNFVDQSVVGTNTTPNNAGAVRSMAVLKGHDPSQPVMFVRRNWFSPTYRDPYLPPPSSPVRPSSMPLSFSSPVMSYIGSAVPPQNSQVYGDDLTTLSSPAKSSPYPLTAFHARTDIVAASLRRLNERMRFLQNNDIKSPLTGNQALWWEDLPTGWTQRYFVNPFPRASQNYNPADPNAAAALPINSKSVSQRQNLLADSCSQFIVEFAGDFVTQDNLGTPDYTRPPQPDGVLDFYVDASGLRHTRFYGLPRDVDGDRSIPGYNDVRRINSPDIIPVADFQTKFKDPSIPGNSVYYTRQTPNLRPPTRAAGISDEAFERSFGPSYFVFERSLPPSASVPTGSPGVLETTPPTATDYSRVTVEPTGASRASPGDSGYECLWDPVNAAKAYPVVVNGVTRNAYAVPKLIRIIVDIRDPNGKMSQPLTQEYVFPVPITGDYAPPANN